MKKCVACLGLILLSACGGTPNVDTDTPADSDDSLKTEENAVAEDVQTFEERRAEIQEMYQSIQMAAATNSNCTTAKSVTRDGLDDSLQFPFDNAAEECTLPGGFRYRTLERNGYEWSETCHFYFKDDKLFFVFIYGGAEACGYEYRVYYDRQGEVMRILVSENACDGDEVGKPSVVEDAKKRKEILQTVAGCQKAFKEISGK